MSHVSQLFKRAARGDDAAAVRIVDEFGGALNHFIECKLRRTGLRLALECDDVVQTVWMALFDKIDALGWTPRNHDEAVALILRFARNVVGDQLRRQHAEVREINRTRRRPSDQIPAVDGEPGPAECAEQEEVFAIIDREVAVLESNDRRLIELYRAGKNCAEIKIELGVSGRTVRRRYRKICRQLGRRFREAPAARNDRDACSILNDKREPKASRSA